MREEDERKQGEERNPLERTQSVADFIESLGKPKSQMEESKPRENLNDFDPDADLGEPETESQMEKAEAAEVQPAEAVSTEAAEPATQKESEPAAPAVEEPKAVPEKKSKKGLAIGLSILVAALILAGAFAVFVYAGSTLSEDKKQDLYQNGRYLEGVLIYDIDVSGKTKEEGREAVMQGLEQAGDKTLLTLKLKDQEIPVSSKEIRTESSLEDVLNQAMLYGREGNFFERKQLEKEAKENGKNFTLDFKAGDEQLNAFAQAVSEKYSVPAKDADVQVSESGGERFTFTPEQVGLTIRVEELKEKLKDYVEHGQGGSIEVAYDETQPAVTLAQLKTNFVKLSTFSTSGIGSGNRGHNIKEAAKIINGNKVMPGETHDIEAILNSRQYAGRWKKAGAYVDGQVVDSYGGGICQVSTTLFNTALMANLEIVQRSNHSMTVGYVELGFDAAISSGGPKLLIKNNTDYPFYIFASADSSKLTVEIYGKQLSWGEGTTYKRISKVLSSGDNGAKKVQATLLYFDKNGTQVSSRTWNSSYRGKKAAQTEAPAIAPENAEPAITTKQTTAPTTTTKAPITTAKPNNP